MSEQKESKSFYQNSNSISSEQTLNSTLNNSKKHNSNYISKQNFFSNSDFNEKNEEPKKNTYYNSYENPAFS